MGRIFWQCGDEVRCPKDSLRVGAFIFECVLTESLQEGGRLWRHLMAALAQ